MNTVAPPVIGIGAVSVSTPISADASLSPLPTSAVTRSWSHVDKGMLFATLGATSFAYSFFGQPLFLAVSRQQYSRGRVTVRQIMQEMYNQYGIRGLFRGAGMAVSGSVISELVYYLIVEYGKEHLPFRTLEQRSLAGGFAAELVSGPLYNPFAVVSQVQMVAGNRPGDHCYRNAFQTTRNIVSEQGWRALFRGTLLTVIVSPLTGSWWLVYELLKERAYYILERVSMRSGPILPPGLRHRLPIGCTSTTDNVILNSAVGAVSSMVIGIVMNPLYVLRLRLQLSKDIGNKFFPLFGVMRNIFRQEGFRAFFKGIRANLFMGAMGGCAFGMTYEGAKKFSDVTERSSSTVDAISMVSR
ncbi:Mitochondrial substrate/solute carrier [Trypanosoma melophagium]|uniref:Mitochondrial substrate/solute carrier n=1 Tax=Trypanosoma melophagium TaxID=715481 RepID=UPI00351AA17E|nr:Mitochondrial substrate/solute carrier [Trypanosoma melophagium]